MRFKIGDEVRIKHNLIVGESYEGYFFKEKMSNFKGKKAVIRKVTPSSYRLEIDGQMHGWTDEMLDPFYQEKTYKTWEIWRDAEKLVGKRFKLAGHILPERLKCGDIVIVTEFYDIYGLSLEKYSGIRIIDLTGYEEWELVKESVTWQEALTALKNQDVTIKVECPNCNPTRGSRLGDCRFSKKTGGSICIEAITEGTWYIEEVCENA